MLQHGAHRLAWAGRVAGCQSQEGLTFTTAGLLLMVAVKAVDGVTDTAGEGETGSCGAGSLGDDTGCDDGGGGGGCGGGCGDGCGDCTCCGEGEGIG